MAGIAHNTIYRIESGHQKEALPRTIRGSCRGARGEAQGADEERGRSPLVEHEVPAGHAVVIPLPLRSQALVCHPLCVPWGTYACLLRPQGGV